MMQFWLLSKFNYIFRASVNFTYLDSRHHIHIILLKNTGDKQKNHVLVDIHIVVKGSACI